MTSEITPTRRTRSDSGAVLVLALVFLLAMGLIAVATAGLAVGAGVNTSNARALSVSQATVESEASLAIATARNKYQFCPGSCYGGLTAAKAYSCTPNSAGYSNLQVFCEGTGGNGSFRTVDFYVCSAYISGGTCVASSPASFALHAEVTFQDLPVGEALSDNQCNSSNTNTDATCGLTATINFWDVRLADI